MARINGIACKHVKGIEDLAIECDFLPNKPNFLVAPNGSGKSSLAVAFSSLNSRRLKMAESNRYKGIDWEDVSLSISFDDGRKLSANADVNELAGEIDVQVIRSGLYANMTNRRVGPRVLSQTKMSVQQCVLYDKVPAKPAFKYSVTAERKKYGPSIASKMSNLSDLFGSYAFLNELLNCDAAFNGTSGKRYGALIDDFFELCISLKEGIGDIRKEEAINVISAVKPLAVIREILDRWHPEKDELSNYIDSIQVNRLIDGKRGEIREVCAYLRYREVRRDLNDMLRLLDRTRYKVKARVEEGKLVVDFPDWDDASNGEIDVLQLCVALFRARVKLGQKKSLLLIDEVFDYLDDANLLVAQHFLLEMMKQFKASGKSLYVVILTHLDPGLFKSYRFKSFHVSYIGSPENSSGKGRLQKLLIDRARCQKEQPEIYEAVSSHYLHFSDRATAPEEVSSYIAKQGIARELIEPTAFREEMELKLVDYFHEGAIAPSEVCCGIRVAVERLCYEALASEEDKHGYLGIRKGTEPRLSYAEEHGVDVPETFHLLGSIYNSCLHLNGKAGELELVRRQLDNNIIRHMIQASLAEFGWAFPGQGSAA